MSGRNFTRVSYSAGASIKYGKDVVLCKTDNLSVSGLYLNTNREIPLNEPVKVTICNSKQQSFKVNAKVVRKEASGIGLQISRLDVGSFVQLRDIVINNSFDTKKVMQESYDMIRCIR